MRRLLVLLALTAAVLAGCGDDSSSDTGAGAGTSGAGGDAVSVPEDICGTVSADDVGTAMGVPVTAEEVPGGGCSYDQEDPRATSMSISAVPTTQENGGFDAAIVGAKGALTDVQEKPVDGGVILSGKFSGMDTNVTTALVDLGSFAVLVQALGGDQATQADQVEAVLAVALDALG